MSRSSNTTAGLEGVDDAVAAFGSGDPVLIHDAADREGEVDLVYPAAAVEPDDVARMRNDAGGLVCVALPDDVCDAWGLPFAQSTIGHPAAEAHDLTYDDRSSFSITVNHRDAVTGITDDDRALTISALGEAAAQVRRATASWSPSPRRGNAPSSESTPTTAGSSRVTPTSRSPGASPAGWARGDTTSRCPATCGSSASGSTTNPLRGR